MLLLTETILTVMGYTVSYFMISLFFILFFVHKKFTVHKILFYFSGLISIIAGLILGSYEILMIGSLLATYGLVR